MFGDVREWLSGWADYGAAAVDWLPGGNALGGLELLLEARQDWLDCPDPTLSKSGHMRSSPDRTVRTGSVRWCVEDVCSRPVI